MKSAAAITGRSVTRAWLHALELTAAIPNSPHRLLVTKLEELAQKLGDAPALLSDNESFTYYTLIDRANRYSRWALDQGITRGDVVCLLMPNRPEYMAIWLGITRIGGIVSLLNTNLNGVSLAHCIHVVEPKHTIVSAEFIEAFETVQPLLSTPAKVWYHGATPAGGDFQRIDEEVQKYSGSELADSERPPVTLRDTALYIYTSGTTGLPKAAKVSHFRLTQWSHWFSGMMDVQATDRMYNCLPMYHSVGGVVATGAVLVAGGSVVVREKFSASHFWSDVVRWNCTLFQYIGELCRYLLVAQPAPEEAQHQIRMCCGNGLRNDIWNDFSKRFRIPLILEFYAATEGTFSLFNVEGTPGSIGRVPSFLSHRFPVAVVKFDLERQEPLRNEQGFCMRCPPDEVGEAIGKVVPDASGINGRFEGYTNAKESEKKILRNVFETGDQWFRTGDLMRKDGKGYFYFVDRVGDTFRWKGENVATSEISEAICAFPGIKEANVYGVRLPNTDGRAGMAALATDNGLDLSAFRDYLTDRLPHYAVPIFLRIRPELQVTSTFKHTKTNLVSDGYDPSVTTEPIYFNDPEKKAFVRLDEALFSQIQAGNIRL
jgi:fatty-acyl-CoA synthase